MQGDIIGQYHHDTLTTKQNTIYNTKACNQIVIPDVPSPLIMQEATPNRITRTSTQVKSHAISNSMHVESYN